MAMKPEKKVNDRERGIMKGKNAELLTNIEINENYHGSKELNAPMPDAHCSDEVE